MKTIIFLLFLALTGPIAFSQNTEEENLKMVIRAETEAYFNRDADAWQNTLVHSDKMSATHVTNGRYNRVSGFDKLRAIIQQFVMNTPKQPITAYKADSFNITSNGNIAWVEYKQTLTVASADSNVSWTSREYRALIKENNDWKILTLITHNPESFTSASPEEIENSLNDMGYKLMSANRLNDATEVFKLNVKLHPKAWNTYDSLGEALAVAGNKKEAIENYEKSVKLNPKNDGGVKALEKLKGK